MDFMKPSPWNIPPRLMAAIALSAALLLSLSATAANDVPPNLPAVAGLWRTQDRDGVIELYPCADKICGRFRWLEKEIDESGQPSRDDRNPDPALRARPLCGMTFMEGFEPTEKNQYANGMIYSPRSGATYSARLTLTDPDTLQLHGYILMPFLGETQIWKRAADPPSCANASSVAAPDSNR